MRQRVCQRKAHIGLSPDFQAVYVYALKTTQSSLTPSPTTKIRHTCNVKKKRKIIDGWIEWRDIFGRCNLSFKRKYMKHLGVSDLSRLKHRTVQCERVCVCRQTDESVPACKQPAICSEFVSREDFQGESKKRTRCLCCSAAL